MILKLLLPRKNICSFPSINVVSGPRIFKASDFFYSSLLIESLYSHEFCTFSVVVTTGSIIKFYFMMA